MDYKEAVKRILLLPEVVQQAVLTEQPLAILDLEADIKHNVFTEGLDAEGNKIGNYSTKPMYVSILGLRRRVGSQLPISGMRGRGKNSNRSKFKNGNQRKSRYFADGYSGFRAFVGRENEYVNLDLTGDLFNSIVSGTSGSTSIIAFLTPLQALIAEGNEERFNKTIFAATDEQADAISKRLNDVAVEAARLLVGREAVKQLTQ